MPTEPLNGTCCSKPVQPTSVDLAKMNVAKANMELTVAVNKKEAERLNSPATKEDVERLDKKIGQKFDQLINEYNAKIATNLGNYLVSSDAKLDKLVKHNSKSTKDYVVAVALVVGLPLIGAVIAKFF
jgi:arsenate reductase-like glutaredoxin family protein